MSQPRYPVYVPTKGRAATPMTIRMFQRDGVPFRAVVRPEEAAAYEPVLRAGGTLLELPPTVTNLLETRLWIRQHAEAEGHARHWQFDDNIRAVRRLYEGRRIPSASGPGLAAVEDFSDRYTNIGVSGMSYQMFGVPGEPAYRVNAHVYSATLVNHRMPATWRLVYNDDTDLCLQAIHSGWATVLVMVFLVDKATTMTVSGGNTDDLYQGDGRMRMARQLEQHWPGIVKVKRRWGREQHSIDWGRFREPQLQRREDIEWDSLPPVAEYGLELRAVKPVRSARLRSILDANRELTGRPVDPVPPSASPFLTPEAAEPPLDAAAARSEEPEHIGGAGQLNALDALEQAGESTDAQREWISADVFKSTADQPIKLTVSFDDDAGRDAFCDLVGRTPSVVQAEEDADQLLLVDLAPDPARIRANTAAGSAQHWTGLPLHLEEPKQTPDETFYFDTVEERAAFMRRVQIKTVRVSWNEGRTQAVRWPDRPYDDLASLRFVATERAPLPAFPVYVPSVGRYDTPYTTRFMQKDGVPHYLVVRPAEADAYAKIAGSLATLLILPETVTNLLETRNWIRDHAESIGAAGHWQFDDNIDNVFRLYRGRRIPADAGPALRAVEDLALRYPNVGIAGLNYDMFTLPGSPPFRTNCHIYSATLILHRMPCRWRLVYNDDTDICLQALTTGWATIQTCTFNVKKRRTMTMSGGNTDQIYQGDGRMQMARALERAWPGIVRVVKKYERPTHQVNWQQWRDAPALLLSPETLELPPVDEYGLDLRQVRPIRSPYLRDLVRTYQEDIRAAGLEPLSELPAQPAAPERVGTILPPAAAPPPVPPRIPAPAATRRQEHAWEPTGRIIDVRPEPYAEERCAHCGRTAWGGRGPGGPVGLPDRIYCRPSTAGALRVAESRAVGTPADNEQEVQ